MCGNRAFLRKNQIIDIEFPSSRGGVYISYPCPHFFLVFQTRNIKSEIIDIRNLEADVLFSIFSPTLRIRDVERYVRDLYVKKGVVFASSLNRVTSKVYLLNTIKFVFVIFREGF